MNTTRRRFLQTAATAVTAFSFVPRRLLGGPRFVPPSETVNLAVVGVGGQGRANARALLPVADARIVAVADPVESVSLEPFYYKGLGGREPVRAELERHYAATTPGYRCAAYEDFRVMLEQEKAIDAVLCATPDHLHAYVSVAAMRAGKHVYCEKPLTHNLWEARLVARVAQETGVATQLGNQGHATEGIRQTCEWLWDGAIGPVREVHAWVGTHRWNPTLTTRPAETPPVPPGVNWDLWLGPRAPRPYHPAYLPVSWRDFWAFGGGAVGDFGCHDLDAACWALDLQAPVSIEARTVGPMDAEITPHGCMVFFHFGPRGSQPPVKLTWYDGGLAPDRPEGLPAEDPLPSRGVLFVGDRGLLLCGGAGGRPQLLPEARMDAYQRPAAKLPRSKGHHREWLDACKGGPPAGSAFGYGARLTELTLLAVLAVRTGKPLDWDAAGMKVRNAPEADALIKDTYRPGWEPV